MTTSARRADGHVRIAYFDDQVLFREALCAVLEETNKVVLVHSGGQKGQDVRFLLDTPVSAVLVALDAQTTDGMATVRAAREVAPELPICVLVTVDHLDRAREALGAGCRGAVSTAATLGMLTSALESLAKGQAFVDPTLGGRLLASAVVRNAASKDNKANESRVQSKSKATINNHWG
jgi:DNA-binding NarL/FixJ family response regulator